MHGLLQAWAWATNASSGGGSKGSSAAAADPYAGWLACARRYGDFLVQVREPLDPSTDSTL